MKFYLITAIIVIFLSSCLKQSIPDAMLNTQNTGSHGNVTATLSYKVNGNPVSLSVPDAGNQTAASYTLAITKSPGEYILDGLTNTGEFTFFFFTDSLTTGNYIYTGNYGDMFFLSFNGESEYVHVASDSLSFNITSVKNGNISGNFSGQLTPLVSAGNPYNTYGTPSSILITNGSFQNIPVIY